MKEISGVIKNFGLIVSEVEKQTIEGMQSGQMEAETTITDRFLGALTNEINRHGPERFGREGLTIRATTLLDRGRRSPESILGADFAILLDIDVEGFQLKKGILCQAKKEDSWINLKSKRYPTTVKFSKNSEFIRLHGQVSKMLQITSDSFVMIYSKREFVVVPASSVHGLNVDGVLYAKRIGNFFKEFLMCFIGDVGIDDDPDHLIQIKENTRKILKIDIRQEKRGTNKEKKIPTSPNYEKINLKSDEVPLLEKPQLVAPLITKN